MKQKQINYPEIKNNDIKVLGRVVSIASANKVAAAEQVFDEKFNYDLIGDYSWDNIIDATRSEAGMDQYTINRLFGKKLKKFDDAFQFDEDGWLLELKVRNLIADDATINNKLTTKDLEVTNNATIKNLHVTENSTFDGDVTIGGNLIVNNKNMGDLIEQILRVIGGDDKTSEIWRVIQDHERRIQTLEACCEDMHNNPTGISLVIEPNPINVKVGESDVAFSVRVNPDIALAGNYTATISEGGSYASIVNDKIHAISEGTAKLSVDWSGITGTATINVAAPDPVYHTVTFNMNGGIPQLLPVSVLDGEPVTRPADPTKEGYTFNTWKLDGTDLAWGFSNPVREDITLNADWTENEVIPNTYTVTFDANGGSPTPPNQTLEENQSVVIPTEPTKTDYVFVAWCVDTENGEAYDFNIPVNSNLHLVAKWARAEEYSLSLSKNAMTFTEAGQDALSVIQNENKSENVSWSSSNQSLAMFVANPDGNGKVGRVVCTAPEGTNTTVTITCTGVTSGLSDTCTVTINIPTQEQPEEKVYSISAFPTTLNLTVGGESGTVAVTLLPEDEEGLTNWTLRRSDDQSWQNYGSGKTVNVTVEPAAEAGSREITFTATVDEYNDAIDPVTVTVVTSAADTPVQNEHYAIFFDTGLGYNEEDPYTDGEHPYGEHPLMGLYPDAFELGRTTFQSGSYQRDLELLSEAAAKAASLEHGRDRSGYTLRWDMGLYDTMPDSNIYVKAIWDGNEFTLTYKDGDEVLSTQTLNAGAEITPIQDPTKEGYTFGGWTNMPAAVNNKIYMPAHDLTVTASWSGNYEFAVSPSTLSMIAGEHTQQLGATLNGTNITENVTWSSSDDSVATVNQTGFVTAVAEGTAIVTATTTDERAANKTATCEITVTVRNPELRHSGGQNASPTLFVGESVDFIEEVLDGPEGCRLVWSPENSSVCEVSVKEQYLTRDATETITIKAVGEGTTTITAALVDSEGNAIMAKNDAGQSYAVRSDVINVTVSADPTVKVTWNTDSNASLTNTSSQNGVSEFLPITLDNNGDAEYHDWTADVEVEDGYLIKDIKVYRVVSGNTYLENTITDNVSSISITHPTTDKQISITTEAIQ